MIIVILMPETLSYLSCFAEPSMDTFSTFSQHFSQPRLLHGLQQWRRFPNTLALVVGVPPGGREDRRAIPGSFLETPQRNLLGFPCYRQRGKGMSKCHSLFSWNTKKWRLVTLVPCVNVAPNSGSVLLSSLWKRSRAVISSCKNLRRWQCSKTRSNTAFALDLSTGWELEKLETLG